MFGFCFVILYPKTQQGVQAKILSASAGSGKTYQLAYQYVYEVIENPSCYRHILAVTFTNKATEEMKSRILLEIHKLAAGQPSNYLKNLCEQLGFSEEEIRKRATEARTKILHDYSHFAVLTIDAFFQRILRAFIKELNMEINYNIELDTATLLEEGADKLIEESASDKKLLSWLEAFVRERIERGKAWDPHTGVLSLGAELFKESNRETLTKKIDREALNEVVANLKTLLDEQIARLKAIGEEATRRIEEAGLEATDFADASRSFIRVFYKAKEGEVQANRASLSKYYTGEKAWFSKTSPHRENPITEELAPLLERLCNLSDKLEYQQNTYQLIREQYRSFGLLTDLYAKVQTMCNEQNLLILSETKHLLAALIGHADTPFIYEKMGNNFSRFMIDEFQDTSIKEWKNFLPLLRNALAQSDRESVLLVGDVKQSIYRWRGSDWRLLHTQAAEDLAEGGYQVQKEPLTKNWRSLRTIVEFNNHAMQAFVAHTNKLLNDLLEQHCGEGEPCEELYDLLANAYEDLEQKACKQEEASGYVSVERINEEVEPPLIERIKELMDKGFSPHEILILVRKKSDGAKVAATLLEFKRTNTNPKYRFDVMTQEALVMDKSPLCSFIIATMQLALDERNPLALGIYNQFLHRQVNQSLDEEEQAFLYALSQHSPEEAFEQILMRYFSEEWQQAIVQEQMAYLQAMHEQILTFCSTKIADISLWLNWWEEHGKTESLKVEGSSSAIEIMTIHTAKGLERKAVLIPYCSWALGVEGHNNIIWAEGEGESQSLGEFPLQVKSMVAKSAYASAYHQEIVYTHIDNTNLLYVALTRAKEALYLFIPTGKKRHIGSHLWECVSVGGEKASIAGYEGRLSDTEWGTRVEFGELSAPCIEKKQEEISHEQLTHYPTHRPRLKLRLPAQRYFEQEAALSPRHIGILMHQAFAEVSNRTEIFQAIEQMERNALLDQKEAEALREKIQQALEEPTIRSWFDEEWSEVRNEHQIIIPNRLSTRRPDRVMIREERAVVVDYKFGAEEPKYKQQILDYCNLLREMGYHQVEGYLWYVIEGKIIKVTE